MQGVPPMQPMQAMGPVTVRVKVIGAKSLTACDANGKSDPYGILRYEGQPKPYTKKEGQYEAKKSKKSKKGKIARPQTTVQKRTLNPHWNQTFDMVLPHPPQPTDILTIELYDYDSVGMHDFMGSAHVEFSGLIQGQERVGDYKVFTKKGTVQLSLIALNFTCPVVDPTLAGNVNANKQTAAESARKRAQYKKWKKSHDAKKDAGKAIGKGLKSLKKMF